MKRVFGKVWPYITIFFVLVLFTFAYIVYYLPVNKSKYHRLIANKNPLSDDVHTVKQLRENTQKDLFFLKNYERLQLRVKSKEAELKFVTQNGMTEIVEEMQNMTCFMQEELYYVLPDGREAVLQPNGRLLLRGADADMDISWLTPNKEFVPMQLLRYMEADHADYYYQKDRLVAMSVYLARYKIPGHKLSDTIEGIEPDITGVAESVEIAKIGKEYAFKANKLKAGMSR